MKNYVHNFIITTSMLSLALAAGNMEAKKNKNKSACCVDSTVAIAKFCEDKRNPIRGKNVLIIGASKGIGNGAAEIFTAAGAHVVGTSRAPQDYSDQPWLSAIPLDISLDESVENFFGPNGDKTVAGWDHIDILILGGMLAPFGKLLYAKASDLFPQINTELLGRHRVVSQVIRKMQDVDNSRIITLSSIGFVGALPGTLAYASNKGALNSWVRSWNVEAALLNKISGRAVCKTIAIAFQGSWINTDLGSLPPSLCNVSEPAPYGIYASGLANPLEQPLMLGQQAIYGNSAQQNLTKQDAGRALLYMATVRNPEWQYLVLSKDEKFCSDAGDYSVECFIRETLQHKCRDPLIASVNGYNYNAAYQNSIFGGNSEHYSSYNCPPADAVAPLTPVPPLPAGYPACTNGTVPGVPANPTNACNVADLVVNPCKPNYTDVCKTLPC